MSQSLLVRPAIREDLPGLLGLYAQLHPGAPALASADGARILEAIGRYPGRAVLVGCLGGEPVSTCTLVAVPNLSRGGTPYALIENVVTDAAHRGRGFARRVLGTAVSAAWSEGCYKVMLMTGSKDPAVLRLYAAIGFEKGKTAFQVRRVAERGP